MSAENIGCLFNALLIIANNVSSIGIASIASGTNNDINAGPLNSSNVITDIMNPKNVEQSNAKIFAGWKLNNKNPNDNNTYLLKKNIKERA